MNRLVIDRTEGKYAICEDENQKLFAIELAELPAGAKPGCVLRITGEGELLLDLEETERRKKMILEKQKKVTGK